MTIALVGPPFDGIGGIQQYLRTLKKALEELGHEVVVITRKRFRWVRTDVAIITHRNYLPVLPLVRSRRIILLLNGIDAEREVVWGERFAIKRVSTIWAISEWTKGLAKKFNKPTEVLYLCCAS